MVFVGKPGVSRMSNYLAGSAWMTGIPITKSGYEGAVSNAITTA